MSRKQEIVLLGAGGHCKSSIDVIENESIFSILGIVDKDGSITESVLDYDVIGTDKELESIIKRCPYVLVTVGQIKSPEIRISLFKRSKSIGAIFPVIKSRTSYVSKSAQIGEGTILFHHTLINTSAQIGTNCIINSKALIEHDSEVGSNCHISTGAILNGGVIVEDRCFIGSGVIVHEGVKIGSDSIISAGAIVRKDTCNGTLLR